MVVGVSADVGQLFPQGFSSTAWSASVQAGATSLASTTTVWAVNGFQGSFNFGSVIVSAAGGAASGAWQDANLLGVGANSSLGTLALDAASRDLLSSLAANGVVVGLNGGRMDWTSVLMSGAQGAAGVVAEAAYQALEAEVKSWLASDQLLDVDEMERRFREEGIVVAENDRVPGSDINDPMKDVGDLIRGTRQRILDAYNRFVDGQADRILAENDELEGAIRSLRGQHTTPAQDKKDNLDLIRLGTRFAPTPGTSSPAAEGVANGLSDFRGQATDAAVKAGKSYIDRLEAHTNCLNKVADGNVD